MVAAVSLKTSCGGTIVYIHHLINGKPYTSQYAHLLSANVKVGDKVSNLTIIGRIGGGSGTPWDSCSTGAHLHYGVSTGHYLGGGSYGYSSWNTFLSRTIQPPSFTNSRGWAWVTRF